MIEGWFKSLSPQQLYRLRNDTHTDRSKVHGVESFSHIKWMNHHSREVEVPVYLKEVSSFAALERFKSVLIVPCRFCPAASMAVSTNRPYFEVLRQSLKTAPYEEFIAALKSNLRKRALKQMFSKADGFINLLFACGRQDGEKSC